MPAVSANGWPDSPLRRSLRVPCGALLVPANWQASEPPPKSIAILSNGTTGIALNTGSVSYGKFDARIYSELASDHPIDLCRYQVANCYMGRAGLINSGGASGKNDLIEAVVTAVINKRAGGTGLISGRKAFQRPMKEGIELLNAIQDVYLAREVTIA
jgi:DhnA family fructose-bisphosphate aldolase class Ia